MTRKIGLRSFASRRLLRIAGLVGLTSCAAVGSAASVETHDPRGLWLRPEGEVQFSFYDCKNRLCAKVVAAKNPEDRAAVGTIILRGAAKTGPNEWKGKIFNAEDGKTYDGVITMNNATELTLKGCLWGVLCSDETWTRISGPHPTHAMVGPSQ